MQAIKKAPFITSGSWVPAHGFHFDGMHGAYCHRSPIHMGAMCGRIKNTDTAWLNAPWEIMTDVQKLCHH